MITDHQPIFIHCLFRSGSTYLFQAFRRSSASYYCYEEPFSEHLLNPDLDLFENMQLTQHFAQAQRHPSLDRPYKHEYAPFRAEINHFFRPEFSYDLAFLPEDAQQPELHAYVQLLLDRARGRPVLQFCRSTYRTRWLHHHFSAIAIYLLRNAHDQFMSYSISPYFLAANLRLLCAATRPPFIAELAQHLHMQRFSGGSLNEETEYYVTRAQQLSIQEHYLAFYTLWALAYLESAAYCNIVIDIDQLSSSASYRDATYSALAHLSIKALDFSDCQIPQRPFNWQALSIFTPIEQEVTHLLHNAGYTTTQLAQLPPIGIAHETS